MLYKPKEYPGGFVPDGPGLNIDYFCTSSGWPDNRPWTKEQCEQICVALSIIYRQGQADFRVDFKRLMNLDGFA